MKLIYPQIKTVLDTEIDKVWVLEIENKAFFRKCVLDICNQINGAEGQFSLYCGDEEEDISSTCEIIFNPLEINLTQKKLLGAIERAMENRLKEVLPSRELNKDLKNIKDIINNLAFDMNLEIEASRLVPEDLIKIAGITLKEGSNSAIEKIIDYMSLVRRYEKNKLFVFININSYFDSEELTTFFERILQMDLDIVLVNSYSFPSSAEIRRIIVDKDLCEITSGSCLGASLGTV